MKSLFYQKLNKSLTKNETTKLVELPVTGWVDSPEKPQTVEKGPRIIIFPDAADITEERNKT